MRVKTRRAARARNAATVCRSATPAANRAKRGWDTWRGSITSGLVHSRVDRRDPLDPVTALEVFHRHDFRLRPMEVVRDKGYLLVQVVEGVA